MAYLEGQPSGLKKEERGDWFEGEVVEKKTEWMNAVRAYLTVLPVTAGRYLEESRSSCRICHRDQKVVSAVMRREQSDKM